MLLALSDKLLVHALQHLDLVQLASVASTSKALARCADGAAAAQAMLGPPEEVYFYELREAAFDDGDNRACYGPSAVKGAWAAYEAALQGGDGTADISTARLCTRLAT